MIDTTKFENGNNQLLSDKDIEMFKVILEGNGYPEVSIGNLMTSLGLSPNVVTIDSMPKNCALSIMQYTTEAKKLKDNWKAIRAGEMSVSDINFVIPETVKGRRISQKKAKDVLKLYYKQMLRQQGCVK